MATEWLLKFHPLVFCKWGTVLCNISSSCQAPGRSHDIEYGHGRTCVHARFQSQLSISALCGKPKSTYCHFTISANATDKCIMSWVEPIILHMFFCLLWHFFWKSVYLGSIMELNPCWKSDNLAGTSSIIQFQLYWLFPETACGQMGVTSGPDFSLSKMSQGLGIMVRLTDVILNTKIFAGAARNVPMLAATSRVAWGLPQGKAVLARTRFREFWWKDPINGLRVFARRGHPCKEPV